MLNDKSSGRGKKPKKKKVTGLSIPEMFFAATGRPKKPSTGNFPAATPEQIRNLSWTLNSMGIGGTASLPQGINQTTPKNASPYRQASDEELRAQGVNVAPRVTLNVKGGNDGATGNNRGVPAAVDPMDQLFQNLMSAVSEGGASFDYESALRQSEKAIREAYKHDIYAVRMGNRQARRQTASGRQELEKMYGSLAQSYADMGEKQFRQGQQLSNIITRQAEQSAQGMTNQAQSMLDENAALAENLGIQQGFAEVSKPLLANALDTAGNIREGGTEDATRQLQYGQNGRNFMQKGSTTARLEGTNRQGDLVGDLQNYLQDSNRNIEGLRGSRAHEIANTRNEMASQAAQMQADASAAQWDQLMALAGLKLDIESERNDTAYDKASLEARIAADQADILAQQQGGSNNEADIPDYMRQYADIIAGTSQPRRNMNVFNQIFSKGALNEGQYEADNDAILKMNPEKAAQLAAASARAAGVPERDIPKIEMAARIRALGSF